MTELSYIELGRLVLPEIVMVLVALVALGIDLIVLRDLGPRVRLSLGGCFATAGCVVAVAATLLLPDNSQNWGTFDVGPLSRAVKIGVLALTVFSIWIAQSSKLHNHIGEYFCLLLLSASGMMLLASSRDLLSIFVSLELSTVPLYALAAFQKASKAGTQVALKYFLFGGISAAITLFGFSLLYGFSGSIELQEISDAVAARPNNAMFLAALVMILGGIGFKLAAAPFHLWAPEVYQTAPTPSAAFIASASKLAGVFILAVVIFSTVSSAHGEPVFSAGSRSAGAVAFVAALSILLGSLAALVQKDVRRLLAFSAVGHAGYMLLALLSVNPDGLAAVVYYATTYGLATLGAFGVCAGVAGDEPGCGFDRLDGLHSRSPLLAACMLVFMLSLAGIPPLAGFFGKFIVFAVFFQAGPSDPGRITLVLLALAASAVSLYYYLLVLKRVYVFRPSPSSSGALHLSPGVKAASVVAAGAVVGLGVWPQAFGLLFK